MLFSALFLAMLAASAVAQNNDNSNDDENDSHTSMTVPTTTMQVSPTRSMMSTTAMSATNTANSDNDHDTDNDDDNDDDHDHDNENGKSSTAIAGTKSKPQSSYISVLQPADILLSHVANTATAGQTTSHRDSVNDDDSDDDKDNENNGTSKFMRKMALYPKPYILLNHKQAPRLPLLQHPPVPPRPWLRFHTSPAHSRPSSLALRRSLRTVLCWLCTSSLGL